jgi:signal transduction histidine kinase
VRAVLAVFTLLAGWLDPFTPVRLVQETYLLLALYAAYAIAMAVGTWWLRIPHRIGLVTHVIDLALFPAFLYLTEGFASPLFVYQSFFLIAAMFRWQTRGLLVTAAAVVIEFNAVGLFVLLTSIAPGFELNRLIIRNAYIVALTALLAAVGVFDARLRAEMARLAAWPRTRPHRRDPALTELLSYAAVTLAAPRVLLIWEEGEEPWRHFALWTRGVLETRREDPAAYDPIVTEELAGQAFSCVDGDRWNPRATVQTARSVEPARTNPLGAELRAAFRIEAALCLPVHGSLADGYFLALDRRWTTSDDFTLGELVGRLVATSLDEWVRDQRARESATTEERLRLASELHDGVVQTLVSAALQLRVAQNLPDTATAEMRERLQEIEHLITEEQRDLRFLLGELRVHPDSPEQQGSLEHRLRHLAQQVAYVWKLETRLHLDPAMELLPEGLIREVYPVVREALINTARHAQATHASVSVVAQDDEVRIVVTDDGKGFSFRGTYDHEALTAHRIGPIALRDRVTRNGGTLSIRSSEAGAEVDIMLPLENRDGEGR